MQGNDWLQIGDSTNIKLGGKPLPSEKLAETEKEAGTGHLNLNWKAVEIEDSFIKLN